METAPKWRNWFEMVPKWWNVLKNVPKWRNVLEIVPFTSFSRSTFWPSSQFFIIKKSCAFDVCHPNLDHQRIRFRHTKNHVASQILRKLDSIIFHYFLDEFKFWQSKKCYVQSEPTWLEDSSGAYEKIHIAARILRKRIS